MQVSGRCTVFMSFVFIRKCHILTFHCLNLSNYTWNKLELELLPLSLLFYGRITDIKSARSSNWNTSTRLYGRGQIELYKRLCAEQRLIKMLSERLTAKPENTNKCSLTVQACTCTCIEAMWEQVIYSVLTVWLLVFLNGVLHCNMIEFTI